MTACYTATIEPVIGMQGVFADAEPYSAEVASDDGASAVITEQPPALAATVAPMLGYSATVEAC